MINEKQIVLIPKTLLLILIFETRKTQMDFKKLGLKSSWEVQKS